MAALITQDVVECSNLCLELDTGHVEEVREEPQTSTTVFCSCTGACKTNRCVCKKMDQGCTLGKCKCKPSTCCRQKEEPAVDIDVLGEVNSSDSEPEDFCVCKAQPFVSAWQLSKNKFKNHEHPHFFQLCLDQQTLELALINNCDWLNMPRIYTHSKFHNTAYRQYILWFFGKLGYQKRKQIPSCIKWAIRDLYPEPSGEYVGYHEAL